MDIAYEEKKVEKEQESLGDKKIVKTVAEKSIDSSVLFSEIYEKYMEEKVSLNVSWTPLSWLLSIIFIYNTSNIEFIIKN